MSNNKLCRGIAAFVLVLIPLILAGCVTWFSDSDGVVEDPAPVVTAPTISNTTPDAGEAVVLGVTATDPQGQTLTYTWDDGGAGGVFTGDGETVNWSNLTPGTYVVTVTVADSDGNTTVQTWTVTVTDPGGGGPTWALTGLNVSNLTPDVDGVVTLDAAVTNPDSVALTYTWAGGGTFTGTGASVTWSSDTAGDFTLSVTVSDGDNDMMLDEDVTVSVVVIPNEAPAFTNFDEDPPVPYELHGDVHDPVATQRIWFRGIMATDPDGDAVTYEWTADGAGEFTDIAVDVDGFASAYWAADAAGTYVITITADDGQGGVASVSAVTGLDSEGIAVVAFPESFDVVGYDGCNMCHPDHVTAWMGTHHADAIERSLTLVEGAYGYRNDHCMDCHAVGKFPVGDGGYIDYETTPEFANIQCEACHGGGSPAGMGGGHKPSPFDPGIGYQTDVDGNYVEIDGVYQYDETYDGSMGYGCGLCHEGSRHGAFESWLGSVHAMFDPFEEDGVTPEHKATGSSCAKCHNGAEFVRVMIDGGEGEEILPEDYDPSSVNISCATCHDPHDAQFEGQLRVDAAGTVIIPFDDTEIGSGGRGNICLTCHNGRRTRSDYDGRVQNGSGHFGPHGNPQAPVLYGVMGADLGAPADYDTGHAHASMTTNSCVDCHMYSRPYISSEEPHLWGHEMHPQVEACATCHVGSTDLDVLMDPLRTEIAGLLQDFVDAWPAAWKDVTDPLDPDLRNRDDDPPTGVGPARDDPTGNAYREALWNYVLVINDKSHGAHNPAFVRDLLEQATARVIELNAL